MPYRVVGVSVDDTPLEYHKPTFGEAAYLASKMADNGVKNVCVFEQSGRQITAEELATAQFPGFKRRGEG